MTTPSQAVFARNLRQARLAAGLTQVDLGLAVGLRDSYICTLESGQLDPRLSTLYRLAAGLGVEPAALLRMENSQ